MGVHQQELGGTGSPQGKFHRKIEFPRASLCLHQYLLAAGGKGFPWVQGLEFLPADLNFCLPLSLQSLPLAVLRCPADGKTDYGMVLPIDSILS